MEESLNKLLAEIHSINDPQELDAQFDTLQSRIATILYANPSLIPYYINHTGRELFRKIHVLKVEHLEPEEHGPGFRPNFGEGIRTFTISVDGINGTQTGGGEIMIGSQINISATPDQCYKFDSWTLSGPGSLQDTTSDNTVFTVSAGDATITANYSLEDYSLTINGSNSQLPSGSVFNCNDTVSVTATPDAGYEFTSWTLSGPGSLSSTTSATTTFTGGAGNSILTANVSLIDYTLSASGSNSSISPSNTIFNLGSSVNITATPDAGYEFTSWTLSGPGSLSSTTSATTTFTGGVGNSILTANVSLINYNLTINGANGSFTTSSPTFTNGSTVSITATPDSGYKFDGWTISSGSGSIANSSNSSTTFTGGIGDTEISASFSLDQVTVTFDLDINGSASAEDSNSNVINFAGGTEQLSVGETITFTATPNLGYETDWYLSGPGSINKQGNTATFTVGAGNSTISVVFTQIQYALTIQAVNENSTNASSIVSANVNTFYYGDTIDLSVDSKQNGYYFSSWTITGPGVIADINSEDTTFTAGNGNVNIQANFNNVYVADTEATFLNFSSGTVSVSSTEDPFLSDVNLTADSSGDISLIKGLTNNGSGTVTPLDLFYRTPTAHGKYITYFHSDLFQQTKDENTSILMKNYDYDRDYYLPNKTRELYNTSSNTLGIKLFFINDVVISNSDISSTHTSAASVSYVALSIILNSGTVPFYEFSYKKADGTTGTKTARMQSGWFIKVTDPNNDEKYNNFKSYAEDTSSGLPKIDINLYYSTGSQKPTGNYTVDIERVYFDSYHTGEYTKGAAGTITINHS